MDTLGLHPDFDLALAAGNVIPLLAFGTEPTVVRQLAAVLRPGGLLVTGMGLDTAHLPLPDPPVTLPDFDHRCTQAGLTLRHRCTTTPTFKCSPECTTAAPVWDGSNTWLPKGDIHAAYATFDHEWTDGTATKITGLQLDGTIAGTVQEGAGEIQNDPQWLGNSTPHRSEAVTGWEDTTQTGAGGRALPPQSHP